MLPVTVAVNVREVPWEDGRPLAVSPSAVVVAAKGATVTIPVPENQVSFL